MKLFKFLAKAIGFALSLIGLCVVILFGCAALSLLGRETYSAEFTLTEEDVQDFKDAAAKFESAILNKKNETSVTIAFSSFAKGYYRIATQYSIAYVRYCENTADEQAVRDYEFAIKAQNDARNLYNETLKSVLLSDSEYVSILFDGWSEEEKKTLLDNNGEIYELREKNEKLLFDYRALNNKDEGWSDAVDELYLKIVMNSNAIADKYGYSNYYDYASKIEQQRNYSREDRAALRGYVREYEIGRAHV